VIASEPEDSSRIIFEPLRERSQADARLRRLLESAQEYAVIYLIAGQRRKGCDGMGELAMVVEEFRESLDDLLHYCVEKGYLRDGIRPDIADAARELGRGGEM
jgi:hypothetical protein